MSDDWKRAPGEEPRAALPPDTRELRYEPGAVAALPGDIIRISPRHDMAPRCLAEVDEVKSWGVTATVRAPFGRGQPAAEYPFRLAWGEFLILARRAPGWPP